MTDLKIFTYDDFEQSKHPVHKGFRIHPEEAADIANAKISKLIGPRVYGGKYCLGGDWSFVSHDKGVNTHQAYLFMVEEIPARECEHEPVTELEEFISSTTISPGRVGFSYWNRNDWYCRKCGVKLKAKWEVAK